MKFLKISFCLLLFMFLGICEQGKLSGAISYGEKVRISSENGKYLQEQAGRGLSFGDAEGTESEFVIEKKGGGSGDVNYNDVIFIRCASDDSYLKAELGFSTQHWSGENKENIDRYWWKIVGPKGEARSGPVPENQNISVELDKVKYWGQTMYLCAEDVTKAMHTSDKNTPNKKIIFTLKKVQPAPIPTPSPTPAPTPTPAPVQPGAVPAKYSQPDRWQALPELNKSIMTFEAKAPHDAIILLSSEQPVTLTAGANVYELIIGGWNNTSSTIRKKWQDNNTNQGVVGGAQLDANNWVKFWISYNNGEIKIGKGEVGQNIISQWTDPNPYPNIKYFSLTNWDVPVEYRNVEVKALMLLPTQTISVNYGESIYFKTPDNKYMSKAKGGGIDLWAYPDKKDIFTLVSKDGKTGPVSVGDVVFIQGPGNAYVKADWLNWDTNLVSNEDPKEARHNESYTWKIEKSGDKISFLSLKKGINNVYLCAEGAPNQDSRMKHLGKKGFPNQQFDWILEKIGTNIESVLNNAKSQNDFDAVFGQINLLSEVSQDIKNQFVAKVKTSASACSISFLDKVIKNPKLNLDINQKTEITNIINNRKAWIEKEGISYN